MQPSPIAESSRLLLPSLRFCIFKPLRKSGIQETRNFLFFRGFQRSTVLLILLSEAISMEKRYFTSDLSSRSYASLTFCRSEWQMPQNRISICTSRSVGSRRLILVDASPDFGLAAEYAFALYVVGCMLELVPLNSNRNTMSRPA